MKLHLDTQIYKYTEWRKIILQTLLETNFKSFNLCIWFKQLSDKQLQEHAMFSVIYMCYELEVK